ncbi:MAG: helix-turn-helix transcriptional regulator [Bacteriovoracaceae bacterium]|nr:helix-turn-helix transcriptional regulator [Bacteriovoracaceae bacterium]
MNKSFLSNSMSLCEALKRRVDNFKKKHPHQSSTQIARIINLPKSTLHRIENLDIQNPSFEHVIKILNGLGDPKDVYEFIKEYYPEFNEVYKRVYSHNINSKFIGTEKEQYFAKQDYFLIMLLAYTDNGTTRKTIREIYGKVAEEKLDELIVEKVLVQAPDGKIRGLDQNINLTQQICKKLLCLTIKNCYRPEDIGVTNNWLTFTSNSVNKEKVMPLIINKMRELNSEIAKIMQKPENKGSDPIFIGLVADTISKFSCEERTY